MIMKVAPPLPKHSPMLGQLASSHTVTSPLARRMDSISRKRVEGEAARTRIQSGLARRSAGTILMGRRAVLPAPFCLSPAAAPACVVWSMVSLTVWRDGRRGRP